MRDADAGELRKFLDIQGFRPAGWIDPMVSRAPESPRERRSAQVLDVIPMVFRRWARAADQAAEELLVHAASPRVTSRISKRGAPRPPADGDKRRGDRKKAHLGRALGDHREKPVGLGAGFASVARRPRSGT
jgi:hypothetical protein